MFRLLALLGGLSVATDMGAGAPLDESLKRCLVATRLARADGCPDGEVSDVLYTSLLQHLGCTAYAHEAAEVWGDDVAPVRLAFLTDFSARSDVWSTWVAGLSAATGRSRARVLATTAMAGRSFGQAAPVATCEVARDASRRLGLPESVQQGLFHGVASWDGTGYPPAAGEAIPRSTRIMQVASTAVLFALHAGDEAAVAAVRRRSGTLLDPRLSEVMVRRSAELLDGVHELDAHESVLDAEPDPVRWVDDDAADAVARTFGDLVDLKSPWLHGHSTGVAGLAATAVGALGLADQARSVQLAGYLHDVGRAGVSSRIWDKPGPLTRTERDQARLHAYQSELVLSRVPALSEVAALAGQHHERCDGSGYHRGVTASRLTMPSRVLAAADAFRTVVEGRPHRAALTPAQAADQLRGEVRSGGLDGDAVEAVLRAGGLRGGARPRGPSGLTERQVEVLRLLAGGSSNREIADRLAISSRTAEHHVQDIYLRIGVSTRAAAALFAMEHGLLADPG